mmetsp:Transcript_2364/g.3526  ORF Transcript_2364/g.3526 Transcript_2364/m.3526 type:complete len:176 (-) Transcript_2364:31-558(-)
MRSLIVLLSLSKYDVFAFSPLKPSPSVLPIRIPGPAAVSPSALLRKNRGERAGRPESSSQSRSTFTTSSTICMAKPKSGSIVDSYQAVSVNCKKCRTRLFRYRKKNGTKSNLIKCYVERISEDCVDLVANKNKGGDNDSNEWFCPNCDARFGRDAMIHGRPAIKLVGGKTTMTKK